MPEEQNLQPQGQQKQSSAVTNIEREMQGLKTQQTKRPKGEKLELLKREDVRTMEKDLASLRAQQAKEEQSRIGTLSQDTAQSATPERVAETLLAGDHEGLRVKSPLPIPPSRTRQILTRVLIAAVALFAIANLGILGIWLMNR